jgi:hypothetical protein
VLVIGAKASVEKHVWHVLRIGRRSVQHMFPGHESREVVRGMEGRKGGKKVRWRSSRVSDHEPSPAQARVALVERAYS